MSRRKSNEHSEKPAAKIPKLSTGTEDDIPYTTTDFLHSIAVNDNFVSIVAYVQKINEIRKLKSKEDRELFLFRFLMNNDEGSTISCVAWNESAKKMSDIIKIDQILLLQNLTAKEKSNFNEGKMPYELVIKNCTKITPLGTHIYEHENILEIVEFLKLAENCGHWIKIRGYLRDEFFKKNNNVSEYLGTITDGKFKVEVEVSNVIGNISFQQGQHLEVVGQIQAHENEIIYVQVSNVDNIQVTDDTKMPLRDAILIRDFITKKPT